MHGEGRQMLGQHIRKKRVSKGLDEIPEDLFAKKPRHEMSEDEYQSKLDRRKKNKEAAERSRKKKKVEFEKLQTENDRLNQDKCELVAMVQKLKTDITGVLNDNDLLRSNYEHLKRWIGKRSVELGLTKFAQSDVLDKGNPMEADLPSSPLTRGNPMLGTPGNVIVPEDKMSESGRQSSSPKPAKEPCGGHHQPASRPQLQTPWLVDPVEKGKTAPADPTEAPQPFLKATAPLSENQPVVVATGQQVIYLPNNAIIVFQGDRAALAEVPEPRQVVMASPKHAVEPPEGQKTDIPWSSSSMASLNGNLMASGYGQDVRAGDLTTCMDPATATAIESLLKLG